MRKETETTFRQLLGPDWPDEPVCIILTEAEFKEMDLPAWIRESGVIQVVPDAQNSRTKSP